MYINVINVYINIYVYIYNIYIYVYIHIFENIKWMYV